MEYSTIIPRIEDNELFLKNIIRGALFLQRCKFKKCILRTSIKYIKDHYSYKPGPVKNIFSKTIKASYLDFL